uniref:Band 4.1-like protein 1 n=1 Tax=Schistocephalus solidus TaxID=70667 RepID=A0A0X3P228_SCHSO
MKEHKADSSAVCPVSTEETKSKSSKRSSLTKSRHSSGRLTYKIRMLDNAQPHLEISISKNDDGEVLFASVCEELGGIVERDYFGLRYTDKDNQRQWLDLGRNVKKQMTGAHSSGLSFRVKHYPGNPVEDFYQEISQYLLYLQLRRDLVQGRLLCPPEELYTLGALIVQAELGDAPDDPSASYNDSHISEDPPVESQPPKEFGLIESPQSPVSELPEPQQGEEPFKNLKIVFNQTKKIEAEILKKHKEFRGLTARDAEIEVLKRASRLPTYGVDPVQVKMIDKNKSTVKRQGSLKEKGRGAKSTDKVSAKTLPADATSHGESGRSEAGSAVYLGLRHNGITTYVGLQPSDQYNCENGVASLAGFQTHVELTWDQIERLACDSKDFIVYLKADETKPHPVIFRCETKAAALALWKWTVDRKSFFTLKEAKEAKKTKTTNSLFRRSHSYRFMGRSQLELKSIASSPANVPQPTFTRVSSLRRVPKSHVDAASDTVPKHSTFPYHYRPNSIPEDVNHPYTDPGKRPTVLSAVTEQTGDTEPTQPPPSDASAIMNVSEELAASCENTPETPIRPVSVAQIEAAVPPSQPPQAEPEPSSPETPFEVTQRKVSAQQDHLLNESECIRAVDAIDEAIKPRQVNGRPKPILEQTLNGEVQHDLKEETLAVEPASILPQKTALRIVKAAAVFVGIVCVAVFVAALETHPRPGQATGWTSIAMHLRRQPFVSSFNDYLYDPVRRNLVNGFSALLNRQ